MTKSTIKNELNTVEFRDIGIEFVKRVDIIESLTERRNAQLNPYNSEYSSNLFAFSIHISTNLTK